MTPSWQPTEATWANAKLYRCDLYDTRHPVSGTRLVWVVVGRKCVILCTPIQHQKWRIRRDDWDKIPHELFVEDDDVDPVLEVEESWERSFDDA